jgi:hypothetical protein
VCPTPYRTRHFFNNKLINLIRRTTDTHYRHTLQTRTTDTHYRHTHTRTRTHRHTHTCMCTHTHAHTPLLFHEALCCGFNIVHFLCYYIVYIIFNSNVLHCFYLVIIAPTCCSLSCWPSSGRSLVF